MNLHKTKDISKNKDTIPLILVNSSTNTDESKVNYALYKKNRCNKYVYSNDEDTDHLITSKLIPEKFKLIFNTEASINNKTNHNSRNVLSFNNFQKEKLFFETENFCKEIYNKKPSELNDKKIFLCEKMNQGLSLTIKDLRNNLLLPRKKKHIHKKLLTNFDLGNLKRNQKKNEQNKKTNYANDYVKHYYDEFKPKMNTRNYLYENYAQNFNLFKHNQIYNIKKNFIRSNQLPLIGKNGSNRVKNFSELIPERIIDTNESKKKYYSIYKTMKDNKKEKFMI